jgi:PhnB protein
MSVKPIPDGYHTLTPYLIVNNGAAAIDFYKKALGATEHFRMDGPGGTLAHAELQIGDSRFMLSDEWPDCGAHGPASLGGTPVGFCIYTENCDAAFDRAIAAGARVDRPVQNQFYGDRSGTLIDPFGHKWTIATHVEDVPNEQMQQRMEEWMSAQATA